ncbi:MAG: DUF4062 domain-containing protein [Bacteroidota bacterium]
MLKKVYISSTYKDLVVYRDAIRDMFQFKGLQEEYTLVSMEGYVAENGKRAIDVCLDDVRQADIYILILAKRYGSVVAGTGISYTEMEYNEAVKVAKTNALYKIFVFWSKEENEKDDFASMPQLNNPALENFYNDALGNNASFIHPFSSPDNLCKQILLTFNYNFKKPASVGDYQDALLLINRVDQSYRFSRLVRQNTNAFYFSSVYENNPNDFVERLYDLEMGGKYKKCNIELAQLQSIDPQKFSDSFIGQLSTQWVKEIDGYQFDSVDKLFLSIELNSLEINNEVKLNNLYTVLVEFLPVFLFKDGKNYSTRVFFIFYSYLANESPSSNKFDDFIKKVNDGLTMKGCLTSMDQLNDVTKTDTRNWLGNFVKGYSFDQDDIDELLQVGDNPFKTFKMKEVNKLVKGWIKKNLFNN